MHLIFHGAAQEVGRSCIEVQTQNDRFLLDCGLKFHEAGFDYPAKVFEVKSLQGVFLSHAHLDHSGGLPFFTHYKLDCPIFCTPETKAIAEILLKDSHKIARIKHLHEAFTNMDLKEVAKHIVHVKFNDPQRVRGVTHEFLNAGHIPGSASIKLVAEGVTVLYTGDYNTRTTQLMRPSDPHSWGHVDVLITECTYGDRELPDRVQLEKEFLTKIAQAISRGGRVLIPVFAVGRAQEILIMLSKQDWPVPIYMDGMAKKVTRAVLDEQDPFVTNRDKLASVFNRVQFVASDEHRTQAARGPGIFVTTSGMLQGGPAIHYLEEMWSDEKSAVLLTGYQAKGTNGWMLNNEHIAYVGGYRTRVRCEVQRYDFSGHLSQDDLKEAILAARPRVLIFNHGNKDSTQHMAAWARETIHCEVFTPSVGEQVTVNADGTPSTSRVYDEHPGQYLDEHQHGGDHDHDEHHMDSDE